MSAFKPLIFFNHFFIGFGPIIGAFSRACFVLSFWIGAKKKKWVEDIL